MAGRVSADSSTGGTSELPDQAVTYGGRPLWVKLAVAAIFLFGSWWILGHYSEWKQLETVVSAWAMRIVSSRLTVAMPGNMIFLYSGSGLRVVSALEVASECSVGYLTATLLAVGALLVFIRRLSIKRILAAIGTASMVLLVFNVVRISMIGAMEVWLGTARGYAVGHVYLGTAVTFVGTLLAGAAFLLMLVIREREGRSIGKGITVR
jgi:exosortase/archaeosortase family protein